MPASPGSASALLLGLGLVGAPAPAGAAVFADGTFLASSWTTTILGQTGSAQTPTASQELSGGNPGAYRKMTFSTGSGPYALEVYYEYAGSSFDPATLPAGEVLVLHYSEDRAHINPPFAGAVMGAAPALRQGGVVYAGPASSFTNTAWATLSLASLGAAAFTEVGVGGSAHPDFTSAGAPIHFGFIRRKSASTGGSTFPHGIDNWSFTTTTAAVGTLVSQQKISQTAGGFGGALSDFDRFGDGAAYLGDVDGDGVGDLAVAAGRDDDGASNTGAVWVLFLNVNGTVKNEQKLGQTSGGFVGKVAASAEWGECLVGLGDLNYDGVPDLAVADWKRDGTGAVWILFLDSDGTVKSEQLIDARDLPGLEAGARLGRGIGVAGDVDGDGTLDLAVGASGTDGGGSNRGGVWIVFLEPDGHVKDAQLIADGVGGLPANTLTDTAFLGIGKSAQLGDLDGDGVPDIAVGAQEDDAAGSNRGAIWIFFLNADGTAKAWSRIAQGSGGFSGTLDDNDQFGSAAAPLGDLDGDGVVDLAVSAVGDDDGGTDRGAVYVLFLNPDGTVKGQQKLSSSSGGFGGELSANDAFGYSLAELPNLAGSGAMRLAATAIGDDDGGSSRGAVWILELAGGNQGSVCGDFFVDFAEECDDGNAAPADTCSAACELEDVVLLSGMASGGTVSVTVSGVPVGISSAAGKSAREVLADLAAAINLDATLQGLGVYALATGREVLYTNGSVTSQSETDPGLSLGSRSDLILEGGSLDWDFDVGFPAFAFESPQIPSVPAGVVARNGTFGAANQSPPLFAAASVMGTEVVPTPFGGTILWRVSASHWAYSVGCQGLAFPFSNPAAGGFVPVQARVAGAGGLADGLICGVGFSESGRLATSLPISPWSFSAPITPVGKPPPAQATGFGAILYGLPFTAGTASVETEVETPGTLLQRRGVRAWRGDLVGVLNTVSPVAVRRLALNNAFPAGAFATLRLRFVPEPAAQLGLGACLLLLILLSARRGRRG